ncbi:MAG: hypothetical protein RL095_3980 [Verrucomicrobiota bacterium]|jgi:hypothetical protein
MKIHFFLHLSFAIIIAVLLLNRQGRETSAAVQRASSRVDTAKGAAAPSSLPKPEPHAETSAKPQRKAAVSAENAEDEEEAEDRRWKAYYKNYFDLRDRIYYAPEEVESRWGRMENAMEQLALAAGMEETAARWLTSSISDEVLETKLEKLLLVVDAERKAHVEKMLLLVREKAAIKKLYPQPELLISESQLAKYVCNLSEAEYEPLAARLAQVIRSSTDLRNEASDSPRRLAWEEQCRLMEEAFATLLPGKPNLEQWLRGETEVSRRELARDLIAGLRQALDEKSANEETPTP